MPRVRLERCEVGVHVISLIKAVRDVTGFGLKEAKDLVNAFEDGEQPVIEVASPDETRDFVTKARSYGAFAVVLDDPELAASVEAWASEHAEAFVPGFSWKLFYEELERLVTIPGSGVTLETRVDEHGNQIESYVLGDPDEGFEEDQ